MKKQILFSLILILILVLIIIVCYYLLETEQLNTNNTNNIDQEIAENNSNIVEESDIVDNKSENIKINLIVNNKTFSATLDNNVTTRELVSIFPLTLNMSDLNSNEKYNYLDTNLTTNASRVNRINAGDIKLFGSNCLVVFYESFNTSYSYTNLGQVNNIEDFVSELGSGSVSITFELAE